MDLNYADELRVRKKSMDKDVFNMSLQSQVSQIEVHNKYNFHRQHV